MEEKNTKHKKFSPEEEHQMWENIKQAIDIKERRKRFVKVSSVAAISLILLFLGILTVYNTLTKPDVYFAETENLNIRLADGSVVTLVKGAKLTVEKSFPDDTRDVFLEGDAFFKVTKSQEHPFIVHGSNYETRVLGTVFKVMQHNGDFKVDLFEGKVAVKNIDTKKEYYLIPHQSLNNYGRLDVVAIIPLKEDQNKTDSYEVYDSRIHLSFSGSTIKDVIEVVEKTYHVKVEYPSQYAGHKISIDNINFSPAAILGTIAAHLDLNVDIDDKTYRLEK